MTPAHAVPVAAPGTAALPEQPGAGTPDDPVGAAIRRLVAADVAALAVDLLTIDPSMGPGVIDGWAGALQARANDLLQEVLYGELTAWRMVHAPFGRAGETAAVDAAFVERVTDADGRWLSERYPEGHRLLGVLTRHWHTSARELHTRLVRDRTEIQRTFGIPRTAPLGRIAPGAGDSHRDGRSVACLGFDGGHRLVYKPRSVRAERVLAVLLSETARAAGDVAWPVVGTADRGEYGWMEFVAHVPVSDEAGVRRFYRRAGILLAVAHAIGMNDLHGENLIARGDQPVIIDAETLLPAEVVGRPGDGLDPAAQEQSRTVLDTGLLPRWVPVYRQRVDVDHPPLMQLGGLGPVHRSRLPGLVWEMTDGRPQRRVRALSPPVGTNLPVLRGEVQEPERHRDTVLEGFATACEVLRVHAAAWSAPAGPIAEIWATPIRVLARNTSAYASALRSATRRSALRDGAARSTILDGRLGRVAASAGEALLAAERAALDQCDVPLFVADPGADRAHPGESTSPVAGVEVIGLTRPPRAASARRLASVARDAGGRHRRRQHDLIRAALAVPFPLPDVLDRSVDAPGRPQTAVADCRSHALRRVAEVADQVVAAAVVRGGRVGWLAVTRDRATGRTATLPAGWSLADGSLGIALFLAAAGRATGITRWNGPVDAILDTALDQVRWSLGPDAPDDGNATDLGLDRGYGGLVWVLAELSDVLDRADLADQAGRAARLVLQRRGGSLGRLDEQGGAAGLVLGLTRLLATGAEGPADGLLREWCGRIENHLGTVAVGSGGDRSATGIDDLARALRAAEASTDDPSLASALAAATLRASDVPAAAHGASASGHCWSAVDDGLRSGTAGRLVRAAATGFVGAEDLERLDRDVDRLRLVGAGVATWLVPGLGDGLAGVGWAWASLLGPGPGPLPWTELR